MVQPSILICDGPEGREEAIEFAMRANISGVYGPWIPLKLTQNRNGNNEIINVRGYDVVIAGVLSRSVTLQVTICGEDLLPANASKVQFRWMNTVDEPGTTDIWAIFNVTADFISSDGGDAIRIFDSESFE